MVANESGCTGNKVSAHEWIGVTDQKVGGRGRGEMEPRVADDLAET